MQTNFSLAQLADPGLKEAEGILRGCVHCGFCLATCPTYLLLGDELDSPRGRIYLIKDMLEGDKPASPTVVTHIDRCLSCLACMTTCPSGVNYMHLVDHARTHIEETYRRPLGDRLLRAILARVLPRPRLFRLAVMAAWAARPFGRRLPGRLGGLVKMVPGRIPNRSAVDRPQVFSAEGPRRMRVALLSGCVQQVLAPDINEATIRLLTRHGCDVVVAKGADCCGALVHHLGRAGEAARAFKANIEAWTAEIRGEGVDAIVANASGCGTMLKDYGFLLRNDPDWAEGAAEVARLARDVSEVMTELGLRPAKEGHGLVVAYHAACSLHHGQGVRTEPQALLKAAGFEVKDVPEGHICCGSAGTYNLLQPDLAGKLRARKLAHIEAVGADVVAAGNIGCIVQLAGGARVPVVHPVELLDWASGGPRPAALAAGAAVKHSLA